MRLTPLPFLFLTLPLSAAEIPTPAPTKANEPLAKAFSAEKAAEYLDGVGINWTRDRGCITCHTNMPYLTARPLLPGDGWKEVRQFLEDDVSGWQAGKKPRGEAYVVATAFALAFNDAQQTGKLHERTKAALDRMWYGQTKTGAWDWLKCDWPPLEHDDYYGATLAALAVGYAPGGYAKTEQAQAGLKKLKGYFADTPPPDLHHTAMLLWAATRLPDLMTDEARAKAVKDLKAKQRADGGWSLPSLGEYKRRDEKKTPNDPNADSDGYGTGFVTFVLLQAGEKPTGEVVTAAVKWLKANQRESGRWFTRSLNNDKAHYIANAGSAFCVLALSDAGALPKPPYHQFPPADPPYYRVRYEPSAEKGGLVFGANYTVWIPPGVKTLRGVIVHQHGCGEGSCKSGLTGAYDLHWQALARKHECALLSPAYEQPDKADCQMWCDPRNGSDAAFRKCLEDLGKQSGHPELASVPWALWGHSGGGHWCGGMVMLHPERVAAAWLRSGVPLLTDDPTRKGIKAHTLPDAALKVPLMCNLGTKEGVSEKSGQFAGVWPANELFFNTVRAKGGLVGVAIDPLSSHDCGNQRYLAIPWLDACLTARLPKKAGDPLAHMAADRAWLAPITGGEAKPAAKWEKPLTAGWLPDEAIAKRWTEYVKDTKVGDDTPPPAPSNVKLKGSELTWEAEADLESGLGGFVIERDGQEIATLPQKGANPFGRPVFQGLQYSDTPPQPLARMTFTDPKPEPGKTHAYRVIALNTAGKKSDPTAATAGK